MHILVLDSHKDFSEYFCKLLVLMGVGDTVTNEMPVDCCLDDYNIIFCNTKYLPLRTTAYVVGISSYKTSAEADDFLVKPFSIQQVRKVIHDSECYTPTI